MEPSEAVNASSGAVRSEVLRRLGSIEGKVDSINGRVRGLEVFKATVKTVGIIGAVVVANGAAWLALVDK